MYGGEVALLEDAALASTPVGALAATAGAGVASPHKRRKSNGAATASAPTSPALVPLGVPASTALSSLSSLSLSSSGVSDADAASLPACLTPAIATELLARDASTYYGLHSDHLARCCAALLQRAGAGATGSTTNAAAATTAMATVTMAAAPGAAAAATSLLTLSRAASPLFYQSVFATPAALHEAAEREARVAERVALAPHNQMRIGFAAFGGGALAAVPVASSSSAAAAAAVTFAALHAMQHDKHGGGAL